MVFLEQISGEWESFTVFGGVVQGNQEGTPVFCLVIAGVLRRVQEDPRLAGAPLIHWLYVDDWIVQVPLCSAALLLDVVAEKAAESHLDLQQ